MSSEEEDRRRKRKNHSLNQENSTKIRTLTLLLTLAKMVATEKCRIIGRGKEI